VHVKQQERGQNGEEPLANSPRWSKVSGKWRLGLATTALLSKQKRTAAVLLGDTPTAVKGGMGAVRHDEAPWLGARSDGLEWRRRMAGAKASARFADEMLTGGGGVPFIGEGLSVICKNSSTESIYKQCLQSLISVRIWQKGD
jgi:hypothetical protein